MNVFSSKCLNEKLPSFESIRSVMGSPSGGGGAVGGGGGGGGSKTKQYETVKVCSTC